VRRAFAIAVPVVCGLAGFLILEENTSNALAAVGGVLLGGALIVALGVMMIRLVPRSESDREREAKAREEFDRTGRWPGE
jgi:membrane protein YqaA with SNARE-associated domain